ncbi:hypothetical protein FQN57_003884 [Myotisia sp. PD_48]|nr:hypothetical protein FQN57_003884 [Myotisia sp. PD_48]
MGKTFRRVTISVVGKFGSQEEKIKQWTEINGGAFSKTINSNVTHLVTTKEAFVKPNAADLFIPVQEAKRTKGLKIVSIDWLEDSLLSKSKRPKREGPYLWARIIKAEKREAIQNKERKNGKNLTNIASGAQRKSDSDLEGHHIFQDTSGTLWKATLVRPICGSKKEKHVLKIYESDSKPSTYAVFAKYTRPGRVGSDFLTPIGSSWSDALVQFTRFFRLKSGKTWNNRESTVESKRSKDGTVLPVEDGWFQYIPDSSRP